MVAKDSAWPLAAEKLMFTDCPGSTTGGVPVPLKVPDSTSVCACKTFSTVIEAVCGVAFLLSSSLHDVAAAAKGSTANSDAFAIVFKLIMFSNFKINNVVYL